MNSLINIGYIILVFVLGGAIISGNLPLMALCVYLSLFLNLTYAVKQFKKRFVFLCFNLTFFTFLVGQMLLADLSFVLDEDMLFLSEFSNKTQKHIYICLFLSLISVYIGYCYFENKQKRSKIELFNFSDNTILRLRKLSKSLMYFFFVFALAENVEKALFVQQAGYASYYTDFHSSLPFFVSRLSRFYEYSFFLYLATLPKKKDSLKPLLLFFVLGFMTLGYGQRNGLVLNTLFVFIYFIFRDYYKFYGHNEVWLTKRIKYGILVGLPFALVFLLVFGYSRAGESLEGNLSFSEMLFAFFYYQGASYRLIGYDLELANQFPSSFPYSLGYIIDLYEQNPLFKLFGVYPVYESHSVEAALYGHNYGDVITYLQDARAYTNGYGLGSCYIAEIFHDFGYVGVIVINFIYGVIIASLNKLALKNVWYLFVFFSAISNILYAPRSAALYFLSQVLTVTYLVYMFIMYKLSQKEVKTN